MTLEADQEIELNNIIREYFSFADYPTTLATLEAESVKRGRPTSSSTSRNNEAVDSSIQELENKFIIAFNEGDRDAFFDIWDTTFTHQIRSKDPIFQKLEFTFSIYFAIFPIHNGVSHISAKKYNIDETMETLKQYLSTRGSSLCKTTQFLSFYALPYVPDPSTHPSFKDLFETRWVKEIHGRLISFLGSALRKRTLPRLVKLLSGDTRNDEEYKVLVNQNRDLKGRCREFEGREKMMGNKHRNLQADYHSLVIIASELVQTLAACINGEQITPAYLTSICQRLTAFKKNHDRKVEDVPIIKEEEIETKPIVDEKVVVRANQFNYEKIKLDIEKGISNSRNGNPDEGLLLLLEAFTIHILGLKSSIERVEAITALTQGDVFQMNSSKSFIQQIFQKNEMKSILLTIKLLNIISSESAGRTYLLGQSSNQGAVNNSRVLIQCLVKAMMEEGDVDSFYRQNLLGTLQKLSLRRFAQTIMIQQGLIPYFHNLLQNLQEKQLSEYTIEYATSLLMNLCLRSSGKRACLELIGENEGKTGHKSLRLFFNLLRYDNDQVKTYACAALYSLLSDATLKEEAVQMNLYDMLELIKEGLSEGIARQLDFVMDLIGDAEQVDEENDAESEDGEEDDDANEDETDMDNNNSEESGFDEDLKPQNENTPRGNDLLRRYMTGTRKPMGKAFEEITQRSLKEPLRLSTLSLHDTTLAEMKRPKTPISRPSSVRQSFSSHPTKHTGILGLTKRHVSESAHKLPPHAAPSAVGNSHGLKLETEEHPSKFLKKKRDDGTEFTTDELKDFDTGFSTRPKVARTPLSNSLASLPEEMKEARNNTVKAKVRQSMSFRKGRSLGRNE